MKKTPFYHDGTRQMQEQFGTRKLADRMLEKVVHDVFTDDDRSFIESRSFFFLATANKDGYPDCSYKGGLAGFVRIVDPHVLAFPSYDGNGMFKSLGNVAANSHVGLLFIDFELATRLRVNGRATLHQDDPLLAEFPGAQVIVRVHAEAIFPNCARYVHRMLLLKHSAYVPRRNYTPPSASWKRSEDFYSLLPPGEQVSPLPPDGWRRRANRIVRTWLKRRIVSTLARMRQ